MPEDPSQRTGAPGHTRPTGHDVANAAGVSQATVSLVLGGKWEGRVSAPTAQRVRDTAHRMGYRPNLAARHLRLGRTRTALLVVPALTNEFFATVHQGAVDIASQHHFGLVLYPPPAGATAAPDPFASASAALDGVIASSMALGALNALRDEGLPLVMLDGDDPASDATVNFDIAHGIRQIATHLLGLGHRHLAHLAADIDSWTFTTRADTLRKTLHGTGASVVRTHRTPLSVAGGLEAATRALTPGTGPTPTALVCDDDLVATGALKAARRLGLRVPEDVSVTGFGDLALATAVEPELTTVHLPASQAGAAGMRALLAVLDGEEGPADTGLLPVHLVPRDSTGPPSATPR